jgi:hypothetical protein
VPPQVGKRVTEEGTTERRVSRRGRAKPEKRMAEPLRGSGDRSKEEGEEETEEGKIGRRVEKGQEERRERERQPLNGIN